MKWLMPFSLCQRGNRGREHPPESSGRISGQVGNGIRVSAFEGLYQEAPPDDLGGGVQGMRRNQPASRGGSEP